MINLNNMYKRIIENKIKEQFFKGKAIFILGPRQVGKSFLSTQITDGIKNKKIKFFNCDNPSDREVLNNKNLNFLKTLVSEYEIIVIDEAQKVITIGQTLKLLVDFYKNKKQFLITGSSTINLLDNTEETMAGRKIIFKLYSLSIEEIIKDDLELKKNLGNLLIYGSYPEVVSSEGIDSKVLLLRELMSSYLYRDILEFQDIKNSNLIFNLLKALALQIGQEVSYNELSKLLGIDKKTVEKYIDLLEKSFVVFSLCPYYNNKRNSISKLRKIYFYDLGMRNCIINNFNDLESRNDVGQLFENFCILERLKYRDYNSIYSNQYFWRNYNGVEVDLIEDRGSELYSYEFKFNKNNSTKPKAFIDDYKPKEFNTITKEKLKGFIF